MRELYWTLLLLLYLLITWLAALFSYLRDARLPANDPHKRNYTVVEVLIAPIVLPIAICLAAPVLFMIFAIRSLLFGVFLLVFPLLLIIPAPDRVKSRLEIRIRIAFTKFGDGLMQLGNIVLAPFHTILRI